MKKYLDWVAKSRLLAPNLKQMTLHVYSNTQVPNRIARCDTWEMLASFRVAVDVAVGRLNDS